MQGAAGGEGGIGLVPSGFCDGGDSLKVISILALMVKSGMEMLVGPWEERLYWAFLPDFTLQKASRIPQ